MIKKFCKKHNITEKQFFGKEIIIDSLDLRGLTSIPEGFNPTVGGSLDLNCLTSIPEGFNPTMGGSLGLDGLTSIPEGFNPTVGYSLNLSGLECDYTKLGNKPLEWQGGKYIKADGLFTEVVNKRGNVFRIKKVNSDKVFYLVTDGEGNYSHGDTLKEARGDLIYKLSSGVNVEKFKGVKLTDKLTFKEAIDCYRVITGACSFGVKDFVKRKNINKRKKYSIQDIKNLTEKEFGNAKFQEFFVK